MTDLSKKDKNQIMQAVAAHSRLVEKLQDCETYEDLSKAMDVYEDQMAESKEIQNLQTIVDRVENKLNI
tara:strand:- start:25568 stop:25774 length:207 start_codon:yes stop_codon:yes gene_type:complete